MKLWVTECKTEICLFMGTADSFSKATVFVIHRNPLDYPFARGLPVLVCVGGGGADSRQAMKYVR